MGLIVIKVYSFICEVDSCPSAADDVVPYVDEPHKLRWAQREVQRMQPGWTFKGKQAWCPNHSAQRPGGA